MKIANKSTQMIASLREIMFASAPAMLVSKTRTMRAVEIKSRSGSSFEMVDFLILIGLIRAATPISRSMFMILLPITFPRSMSVLPLMSEEIETASSGAPVPIATMVSPINCFDILKFEATDEAPDTSQSAPLIKRTKPMTSKVICSAISICLFD